MSTAGKQIVSTLASDGQLTVALQDHLFPAPDAHEVLVQIEAAPINPSDLALLFGPADLEGALYQPGRIIAQMPPFAVQAMAGRLDQAMPVGNEAAGVVIAAGSDPYAQSLLGKRIACRSGTTFATHTVADARTCLPLGADITAVQGAGAFVNPLTALAFVETMRSDGFTGIIHTAAASNLGQMLVRLCQAEGIPLINVVRSAEQAVLLKGMGAEWVINSSDPDFFDQLVSAIAATGAMLGFDAIGGGKMAATLLSAMEQVASRGADYSRYGSNTLKRVYIYGALDLSPTILPRSFGFAWDLAGWLLIPFLAKLGAEGQMRLAGKVAAGLTTTFASTYKAEIGLEAMLSRDVALAYNAKATGEKYLLVP
jgi:NADPH:quinone reductase-like Zn-dependent oxidoreductase